MAAPHLLGRRPPPGVAVKRLSHDAERSTTFETRCAAAALGVHDLRWDHAGEFFAGPGADPKRAFDLATRNLENQPTQRARLVAIEAAHAAENRAAVCRLVRGAPKTVTSKPLADALAEHRTQCK